MYWGKQSNVAFVPARRAGVHTGWLLPENDALQPRENRFRAALLQRDPGPALDSEVWHAGDVWARASGPSPLAQP